MSFTISKRTVFISIVVYVKDTKLTSEENAKKAGATVLTEKNKGYGNACLKGLEDIANQNEKPNIISHTNHLTNLYS